MEGATEAQLSSPNNLSGMIRTGNKVEITVSANLHTLPMEEEYVLAKMAITSTVGPRSGEES